MLNPKRIKKFLNELKIQKIELPEWDFQTRVDSINREILKKLKKANVNQISLGIEDIHDSVLQACGKIQTFSQIEQAVKTIKEVELKSHSNFILGLPSQTREQMLETISYAYKLDWFNYSSLKPFPGSKIYENPEKFGITILSKEWASYIIYEIPTESDVFPKVQQQEVFEKALRQYSEVLIERKTSNLLAFFESKYYLEVGFKKWYQKWKKDHYSGWN